MLQEIEYVDMYFYMIYLHFLIKNMFNSDF